MPATAPTVRSTAGARRATVVAEAVRVFARSGYHATPVTDVAAAAGISQAYVFRLFGGKLGLFVAALESCHDRVLAAIEAGADAAAGKDPDTVLDTMGLEYARLIADQDLLRLQVHAQSAADVPEIGATIRKGYARLVTVVGERSGASDLAVQRFIAYGQLCHLIVTLGAHEIDEPWARTLDAGMDHPGD